MGGPWVESLDGPGPDDAALRRTAIRTAAAQVCARAVRELSHHRGYPWSSCVDKSGWTCECEASCSPSIRRTGAQVRDSTNASGGLGLGRLGTMRVG